ncbi:hypothetical protein ACVWWG_003793 [Bradyrhizobium sp. LB7.2]
MSGGEEPAAQFRVIVDLAVEDNPDPPVLVCHGLGGGGVEVDNGEAPVAETYRAIRRYPQTFAVGAAVGDGTGHRSQRLV